MPVTMKPIYGGAEWEKYIDNGVCFVGGTPWICQQNRNGNLHLPGAREFRHWSQIDLNTVYVFNDLSTYHDNKTVKSTDVVAGKFYIVKSVTQDILMLLLAEYELGGKQIQFTFGWEHGIFILPMSSVLEIREVEGQDGNFTPAD